MIVEEVSLLEEYYSNLYLRQYSLPVVVTSVVLCVVVVVVAAVVVVLVVDVVVASVTYNIIWSTVVNIKTV